MMGRTAVHTQEQVFEAADQLAAKGQDVSANALRDVLGRGSYSTFVKHIEAWQLQRKAVPAPVFIEMPDGVKLAFAQCWQAAATEAGKEIAAIREKSEQEIKASKRRLDEALAVVEELEAEAEATGSKLEESELHLRNERQAVQQAAAREAGLSASVTRMTEQIGAQEAELKRVHAEAEASRRAHEAELKRMRAELDALLERERAEVQRTSQAKSEAQAAVAQAANLTEQLELQKAERAHEVEKLEAAVVQLGADLAACNAESRDLVKQLGHANGELMALRGHRGK
jgi:chromosome segregation ATPase